MYAFASAAGNNGSAFAGLSANTPFYNLALAVNMLMGRFGVIVPVLAIAGSMAEKKLAQPGPRNLSYQWRAVCNRTPGSHPDCRGFDFSASTDPRAHRRAFIDVARENILGGFAFHEYAQQF